MSKTNTNLREANGQSPEYVHNNGQAPTAAAPSLTLREQLLNRILQDYGVAQYAEPMADEILSLLLAQIKVALPQKPVPPFKDDEFKAARYEVLCEVEVVLERLFGGLASTEETKSE